MKSILAFVLAASFAFAADKKTEEPVDERPVKVHLMKEGAVPVPGEKNEIIPPRIPSVNRKNRDEFFAASGLTEYVKGFDDLDRNIFVQKLQRFDISRMYELYPGIPKDVLAKAQKDLRGEK